LSTILLVEDTIANRALVVKLLKAAGHEVIEAADGPAGIRSHVLSWEGANEH
jgi:CheY-like chemotaxis protein